MSDELLLPQVPEPKPEDPEDVSWALSTAEAMWARGDHSEGVKWVRRAAEAASDAEQDERSLELAKAAADLAGLVSRRVSRASIHIDDSELEPEASAPPPPVPARPAASRPAPPKPSPGPKAPTSVTKQVSTPSRPPAPLPSKTSQPPPAMGAMGGTSGMGARPAPVAPTAKPFGTNSKSVPPKALKPEEKVDPKQRRRSTGDLDAEPRGGIPAPDTSPDPVADTSESPIMRRSRPELGSNDPTFVGNINDIIKSKAEANAKDQAEESGEDRSADEWDASPTMNLTGDEMGFPAFPIPNLPPREASGGGSNAGDRKTSVALPPPDFKSTVQAFPKPKAAPPSASPSSSPNGRGAEPHDPGIVTTQAIRIVVWRDGNGVHVAPAGTVVSAITVDAVLVALDSNADLTAWLTQKGR